MSGVDATSAGEECDDPSVRQVGHRKLDAPGLPADLNGECLHISSCAGM